MGMGSNKKPVYKRGKTVKVVDPKTGDVTTRTDVDIDQFTQAKPVYDEDLDRWVIKDKYGNIDEGDDESSDDDELPAMRMSSIKPKNIRNEQKEVIRERKNSENMSNASQEEKENVDIDTLQKEIAKLKKENESLKKQ